MLPDEASDDVPIPAVVVGAVSVVGALLAVHVIRGRGPTRLLQGARRRDRRRCVGAGGPRVERVLPVVHHHHRALEGPGTTACDRRVSAAMRRPCPNIRSGNSCLVSGSLPVLRAALPKARRGSQAARLSVGWRLSRVSILGTCHTATDQHRRPPSWHQGGPSTYLRTFAPSPHPRDGVALAPCALPPVWQPSLASKTTLFTATACRARLPLLLAALCPAPLSLAVALRLTSAACRRLCLPIPVTPPPTTATLDQRLRMAVAHGTAHPPTTPARRRHPPTAPARHDARRRGQTMPAAPWHHRSAAPHR